MNGCRLSERSLAVRDFAAQQAAAMAAAARSAEAAASGECGLCLDAPEEPVAGPCGHVFCNLCITDAVSQERK